MRKDVAKEIYYYSFYVASQFKMIVFKTEETPWLLTHVLVVTCVWSYATFLLCSNGLGIGKRILLFIEVGNSEDWHGC